MWEKKCKKVMILLINKSREKAEKDSDPKKSEEKSH